MAAPRYNGAVLQGLADTFHRREQDAHREAIDDRTCGRTDAGSLGRESANASARQLVLDTIKRLEKGNTETIVLGREAHAIAGEIAHRLRPFIDDGDARRIMPLLEGWVRLTVCPIIDEREEAVGRQFELEDGRRARVSRFLRRVAGALEGS